MQLLELGFFVVIGCCGKLIAPKDSTNCLRCFAHHHQMAITLELYHKMVVMKLLVENM